MAEKELIFVLELVRILHLLVVRYTGRLLGYVFGQFLREIPILEYEFHLVLLLFCEFLILHVTFAAPPQRFFHAFPLYSVHILRKLPLVLLNRALPQQLLRLRFVLLVFPLHLLRLDDRLRLASIDLRFQGLEFAVEGVDFYRVLQGTFVLIFGVVLGCAAEHGSRGRVIKI